MKGLTPEQAASIRARANGDPYADLQRQVAEQWEALWFYENWVAALELKLRYHGIDPSLEEL